MRVEELLKKRGREIVSIHASATVEEAITEMTQKQVSALIVIENDIPGNARKVGQYLKQGLQDLKSKYGFVTEVRGEGLLLAMEFDKDISAEVVDACIENGMLINKLKTSAIRFIPPLVMTTEEADEALGILDKVLAEMS